MTDSCVIKSMPHGISLTLNPDISFEELCTDICRKFYESREFFGSSILTISFSGQDLSPEEEEALVEAVELNSDIKIRLIYDGDELKDRRTIGDVEKFYVEQKTTNALIHRGNVKEGQKVSSVSSLLVLGDVEEGASLTASGSITVMGTLAGSAATNDASSFVAAAVFDDASVTVGNVSGEIATKPKKSLFGKNKPIEPVAVKAVDGELVPVEVNAMF